MTGEEFRVEVDLDDPEHGLGLGERIRSFDLDEAAKERLGGQATVTRDGAHLFVYVGSPEAAQEVGRVVGELLAADDVKRVLRRPTTVSEARFDWLDDRAAERPEWIAAFLEMKTVWHPIGV
jgi:hypothetical protein